jgi:DNA-binding NarL/FixJ family response regulator
LPDFHASLRQQRNEDATLRILFIGPRTAELFSLRDTLEQSSTERWRVSEVEGTEEGVAVLHTERFHLLVVDDSRLMSSRRNSLEVLRQAAPSTPIILRTTYRSHQTEADAAQVGVEAVLPSGDVVVLRQAVLRIARRIDRERE